MKGVLKKELIDGWVVFSLYDENNNFVGSTKFGIIDYNSKYKNLSYDNCKYIELGYNLQEMVDSYLLDKFGATTGNDSVKQAAYHFFEEAMRIVGDKRFTTKDMVFAYIEGTNDGSNVAGMCEDYSCEESINEAHEYGDELFKDFTDTLKEKTEWEVEIELEKIYYPANIPKDGEIRPENQPKLDSNGCLILKNLVN
jgi:hypothetical protein